MKRQHKNCKLKYDVFISIYTSILFYLMTITTTTTTTRKMNKLGEREFFFRYLTMKLYTLKLILILILMLIKY